MRSKYQPKQYIELVERLGDSVLDKFMNDEIEFIKKALKKNRYRVFDLGAGYGRVIPPIASLAESIVAIEIDDDMFGELETSQKHIKNLTCLKEDITQLPSHVTLDHKGADLFLLCQNTLGVIEGDYRDLLIGLRELGEKKGAEIIISVFNQTALKDYGVSLYEKLKPMVGEISLDESRLHDGMFVSKSGYVSKWRSKDDMQIVAFTMGADIVSVQEANEYSIYHLKISAK